jgi:hypothetical protein
MLKDHVNFNVPYNSLERENEGVSICMENTRTKVLEDIQNWAEDKDGVPVCWLYGPAGSGKSTIAHTIAQEYDQGEPGKKLAFSYFFSRRNPDRNDMTKFVTTFAYQLAHFLPSVQQSMKTALNDPSIPTNRRQDQFTNLIIRPVQSITKLSSLMIIVIDGLDEYDELSGEFPLKDLIQLLVRNLPGLPFRLLFTSRPKARIKTIFSRMSSATCCIALQDYRDSDEIFDYLRSNLSNIREPGELPQGWPSTRDLWRLAEKSEGIWIYASTLVKFVNDEYDYPPRKLELALKAHVGLDALFEQVLGDAKKYHHFSLVLGALVFVREDPESQKPPTIFGLSRLLLLDSVYDIRAALRGCLSILLVPDDHDNDYIRPYDASLFDFLTDPNWRRDRFINPVNCNGTIVEGCIQLITAGLQSDAEAFRHACLHWCHHIHMMFLCTKDASDITSNLGNRVESFLKDLLLWFKIWMVGCGGHGAVEQARNDLHAACGMVGQAMLIHLH